MTGFTIPGWRVTSPFGTRVSPTTGARRNHNGVDFGQDEGVAIPSVADGAVEAKGVNLDKRTGFGHWVRVRNYDGSKALYAHMKAASPLKAGAAVKRGQSVGLVGSTGASTGPHLHLEITVAGKYVEPLAYMRARPVPSKPPSKPAPAARRHVVARGESLSLIAARYKIDWRKLYELNRATIGADPNRIFVGQVLTLPGAAPKPPTKPPAKPVQPASRVHVVARGDTLSKIAKKYGTTWQKLYADNRAVIGNNPNRIYAGQRLVVK